MKEYTVKDVYAGALALISQKPQDSEEWDALAPAWMNLLLAEALPTENALRRLEGAPPLFIPQQVETLEDQLIYRPVLCAGALVNGMASVLWDDAGETYKAQDYRARFINALQEAQATKGERMVDVYA